MIPSQAKLIPTYIVMSKMGLVGTHMSLILPAVISPLNIFFVRQYMLTIPDSYEEAAYIDGAGRFRMGIARDIFGTEDRYVLPVQSLQTSDALIDAFQWLMREEDAIRARLHEVMPQYCAQAARAGDEIRRLWKQVTA